MEQAEGKNNGRQGGRCPVYEMVMNHLSLFSGAGGELLASKYFLGWRTIGYVEWIEYRQRSIAARISDGLLDEAPIFGDIDLFVGEGYAASYTGLVDVITAGFPCQAWSAIGKHGGEGDERNKWPETFDAIRIIRPRYVLLENSTNIVTRGFVGRIISELAALGYVGRWTSLCGLHTGEHSKRERAWIKAQLPDATSGGSQGWVNGTSGWEAKDRSIPALGENQIRMDLPNPRAFGTDNGDTYRVDRTKAIGDMQYASVAALAWNTL